MVTGSAGYIGSHTVLQLLDQGFSVLVIDNLDNASETNTQASGGICTALEVLCSSVCPSAVAAMAKNCPPVSAEYQEAVEEARRKLHALIAQHNCASLKLCVASKFDVSSRTGHTFEITKTNPTKHGLVANAGIEDIAVKMLEPIKGEFPIISYADLYQLAGSVAVEMSGGPDIPFRRKSELAGSVAVQVSGGPEIPRQESEVMEVAAETSVPIDEMVRSIRLETKIPRFPRGLHRIGGQDNRYIIPSVVALGPYYHGLPKLQQMEVEKHAAARYLCMRSGRSIDEAFGNILFIVHQARSCYVDTAVAHLSDEGFAKMMFFDGCFLLRYIMENVECARSENRMTLPPGPSMLRDIFLLENQLPWLVLEALVTFNYDTMYQFVARMAGSFDITAKTESSVNQSYKPPHLLGLLRHHQIGNLSTEEFSFNDIHSSLASSAIELAEIGIKLTASKKTWFADTSIQKGLLFGKLPLTPLVLSDFTASWLVNMVAFEVCLSTSYLSDGYTICSYLSLLAMLMDKVEDVHALRAQHLLRSSLSNQETLDFFKGLAHHLPVGHRYMAILKKIEEYKCQRTVRIVVHKFIYNKYYKTIPTLFSVGGVITSIFFGCMSLKQHTGSRHVG